MFAEDDGGIENGVDGKEAKEAEGIEIKGFCWREKMMQ